MIDLLTLDRAIHEVNNVLTVACDRRINRDCQICMEGAQFKDVKFFNDLKKFYDEVPMTDEAKEKYGAMIYVHMAYGFQLGKVYERLRLRKLMLENM